MLKRLRKTHTSQLSTGFMNTCTYKSTQEIYVHITGRGLGWGWWWKGRGGGGNHFIAWLKLGICIGFSWRTTWVTLAVFSGLPWSHLAYMIDHSESFGIFMLMWPQLKVKVIQNGTKPLSLILGSIFLFQNIRTQANMSGYYFCLELYLGHIIRRHQAPNKKSKCSNDLQSPCLQDFFTVVSLT